MVNLRPRRCCFAMAARKEFDLGDEEDTEEEDLDEEPNLEFLLEGPAAQAVEEGQGQGQVESQSQEQGQGQEQEQEQGQGQGQGQGQEQEQEQGEEQGQGGDEPPEEVTFASAQVEAEEEEKRLREALRRDKELQKEKRKRREELFTEQKKRKLLPATLLEELTTAPQTKINESSPTPEKGNTESEDKEKKEDKMFPIRVKKRYMACRLKDQDLIDLRQQAAKGFIQKHLYGRGSNRTTVNKSLSLDNKRLPVKKPAVKFVNNNWGMERKQSAKKFKKQWMHKKKLASRRPSST
ncbi:U3 small nucleolar RNA-associated protein NOL7 [Macrotis lagotis]|uniref:U3 small nucleolar RNA-associated protein NOL7 n=1 Tax=Macrotis lagotis TaxID=92651 RepID=UPI003D691155